MDPIGDRAAVHAFAPAARRSILAGGMVALTVLAAIAVLGVGGRTAPEPDRVVGSDPPDPSHSRSTTGSTAPATPASTSDAVFLPRITTISGTTSTPTDAAAATPASPTAAIPPPPPRPPPSAGASAGDDGRPEPVAPTAGAPPVVARPAPLEPPPPAPAAPAPPWSASRSMTSAGHVSTAVGCVEDTSAPSLDAFFAGRVGPVLGWDYQHVYELGDGRVLWLFQDVFIDHSGTAERLDRASFVHNAALIQEDRCFRLLHRGTADRPAAFEPGTGTATLRTWFWPMGGEVHGGLLHVFWVEMAKDAVDPTPPDGLGWHPVATHLAAYDPLTLERLDLRPAPDRGARPIYGYAVVSDRTHTYLFGNTFEQNLAREGGYGNGPHSATRMYLARVPRGQLHRAPEYWTPTGWQDDPGASRPFLARHWAELPMQPRRIDGRWVATTAVDGYWGDELTVDVAPDPWGPWTTVRSSALRSRGADPLSNTYHAHPLPWRDGAGGLIVTVSNNARDMRRDAWPVPARYRPVVIHVPWPDPPPTSTSSTSTSTSSTSTTTPTTTGTSSTPTTAAPPETTDPPTSTSASTTTIGSSTSVESTITSTTATEPPAIIPSTPGSTIGSTTSTSVPPDGGS